MKYENFVEAKEICEKIDKLKTMVHCLKESTDVKIFQSSFVNLTLEINEKSDGFFQRLSFHFVDSVIKEHERIIENLIAKLENL